MTEARAEFADLVNRVAYSGERIALTRRGKVMAALVSAEDLELLESLREGRLHLIQTGSSGVEERPEPQPAPPPHQAPLRIAAQYRPPGPGGPQRPGFTP
ncbi:type II toxin-antitoxin system Phd/YefM family antitoxin [Actinomadura sp. NBRC 104425]|uniref:type II toxin-antitoxin system Phd/YefM family antitoxin n=1 Tax=Actinomadura sp. NBRC 104425 TaxID=3032204 RepID=UPI0025562009|nr:type II toxin-antitoxin system Phd/YefM family antitoxin [Actinomadura sp. NBRC 104425]